MAQLFEATRPARSLPSFQGYEHAFQSLESAIWRARQFASIQDLIADEFLDVSDRPATEGNQQHEYDIRDAMVFLSVETARAIDDLQGLWLHLHNAGVAHERKRGA